MKREFARKNGSLVRLVVLVLGVTAALDASATFLLTERNASRIHTWDMGLQAVYHTQRSNDADINLNEGSNLGWIAEHFSDHFGSFTPGSGSGLVNQFDLGAGGRTHYHYPKHVTVFNNEVLVTSRNDGFIYRYDQAGNEIDRFASGGSLAQGMATDGTNLFVSYWDGAQSRFNMFDAGFSLIGSFLNPTGLNFENIFDFAFDADTGDFFGLATNGESGTGTQSDTIVQFAMGGSVNGVFGAGIFADGIGQFILDPVETPEPASLALLGLGLAGFGFGRKRKAR